jgi:cytochrome c oxidase subunit IV
MENQKTHIIPYKTFLYVLAILITLTLTSVAVTQFYLGSLTVAAALVIAVIKSSFMLRIFMHLKFENKIYTLAVVAVILILCVVILITLLDYLFR